MFSASQPYHIASPTRNDAENQLSYRGELRRQSLLSRSHISQADPENHSQWLSGSQLLNYRRCPQGRRHHKLYRRTPWGQGRYKNKRKTTEDWNIRQEDQREVAMLVIKGTVWKGGSRSYSDLKQTKGNHSWADNSRTRKGTKTDNSTWGCR